MQWLWRLFHHAYDHAKPAAIFAYEIFVHTVLIVFICACAIFATSFINWLKHLVGAGDEQGGHTSHAVDASQLIVTIIEIEGILLAAILGVYNVIRYVRYLWNRTKS